jgi:Zn finger protein HypA/HybF involved in hydrogenase expression
MAAYGVVAKRPPCRTLAPTAVEPVHEFSLATGVCRIVERAVGAGRLDTVTEVGLEIGDAFCVELASLEFCLETLLASPPFQCARPAIRRIPGDDLRVAYVEVIDDDPADRDP